MNICRFCFTYLWIWFRSFRFLFVVGSGFPGPGRSWGADLKHSSYWPWSQTSRRILALEIHKGKCPWKVVFFWKEKHLGWWWWLCIYHIFIYVLYNMYICLMIVCTWLPWFCEICWCMIAWSSSTIPWLLLAVASSKIQRCNSGSFWSLSVIPSPPAFW